MIRNILSIITVLLFTTLAVIVNLILLPLHNIGMIFWSKVILFLMGVRLKVYGREKLKKVDTAIILINHESALDIPIAVAATEKYARFMAKKELFRIPFFGWLIKLTGHIPIDRENRNKALNSIEKVSKKLIGKNISIIVSPEGTRSKDGRIGPFKKGAFHLAAKHNLPLIPVTLMGARYCVPNKSFRIIPGEVKVTIGNPVYVKDFQSIGECIQKIRQEMVTLKDNYEKTGSAENAELHS